ncbi:uncharacterized protein L3040_002875 [Drepanopeziza brunnea f. sp. 'multigermtubi']|nr:hypothetical protein L3040_002875 [Drepanopeziza brunnea f. sp. 'multigermtubi']
MPVLNRGPASRKPTTAPIYQIAPREITAVEHPMIVQNLDKAMKTFGRNRPFKRILDSVDPEESIPLYIRHEDPMCVPILSRNAPTNNVLLKITVPKRTGRKRKRGSQEPYANGNVANASTDSPLDTTPSLATQPSVSNPPADTLRSHSRMDNPSQLLRKLKDNVGKYQVEAVGEVRQTHRFRGMADFHQSTSHTEFIPKFEDTMLTGRLEEMRKFKFNPSKGWKTNEELVPPPIMSSHALPFNWGWHQASQIEETLDEHGKPKLLNKSKPGRGGVQYLGWDVDSVPSGPDRVPEDSDELHLLIGKLKEALAERPIWTRRSLANRIGGNTGLYLFKQALPFVGYQFRGGPWRDALIKFGLDPRADRKYREYQTFFFQIIAEDEKIQGAPWLDSRQNYTNMSKLRGVQMASEGSHVFDGKKLTLDGKIWQVCDIKVPILQRLMENAPYREVCEPETDGWYCNGTIAKFKAIMKTTLIAIRSQRAIPDEAFAETLKIPDVVSGRLSKQISVPLPDLGISKADLDDIQKKVTLKPTEAEGTVKWEMLKKSHKYRAERIKKFVMPNLPGAKKPRLSTPKQDPKLTKLQRKKIKPEVDRQVDPAAKIGGQDVATGEPSAGDQLSTSNEDGGENVVEGGGAAGPEEKGDRNRGNGDDSQLNDTNTPDADVEGEDEEAEESENRRDEFADSDEGDSGATMI